MSPAVRIPREAAAISFYADALLHGSEGTPTPVINLRELRQIWHDNPPSVIVLFGVVFSVVWYRVSSDPSSAPLLYVAAFLLAAGALWEALWLDRRHAKSALPLARSRRRPLRVAINASIAAWFVLLVVVFVLVFAPGGNPTLVGGLVFVGVFAAYPIAMAGAVFLIARRLRRKESEARHAGR